MKLLKTMLFCGFISFCLPVFAFEKSTLVMTVVNQSSETFTFAGVTDANPGNLFSVTPTTMEPGEAVTVIGDVTDRYSLAGGLRFKDSHDGDNVLIVLDRLQFKQGGTVFSMNNAHFSSAIKYKTFNPEIKPLALLVTSVEVFIKDNNRG